MKKKLNLNKSTILNLSNLEAKGLDQVIGGASAPRSGCTFCPSCGQGLPVGDCTCAGNPAPSPKDLSNNPNPWESECYCYDTDVQNTCPAER